MAGHTCSVCPHRFASLCLFLVIIEVCNKSLQQVDEVNQLPQLRVGRGSLHAERTTVNIELGLVIHTRMKTNTTNKHEHTILSKLTMPGNFLGKQNFKFHGLGYHWEVVFLLVECQNCHGGVEVVHSSELQGWQHLLIKQKLSVPNSQTSRLTDVILRMSPEIYDKLSMHRPI